MNCESCLHICKRARNVIFHPLQVFILVKQKKGWKKETLPSAEMCNTWPVAIPKPRQLPVIYFIINNKQNLFIQNKVPSCVTYRVCFCRLHCAIRLTFSSQLHTISCKQNKEKEIQWPSQPGVLGKIICLTDVTLPRFAEALNSSISSSSESSMRGVNAYLWT